jgi:hypothetical protein
MKNEVMKREESKPRAVSAKIESRTKPLNIRPKESVNQIPSYTPISKNQSPSSYNQNNHNIGNYHPVSNNHNIASNHININPVSNNIYNRDNLYAPHSNDYRNNYKPSTNLNDDIYRAKGKK